MPNEMIQESKTTHTTGLTVRVRAAGPYGDQHVVAVDIVKGDRLIGAATVRPDLPAVANGYLFAAAPTMLAKLKEIHGGMACSCRLQPFVDGPVPCKTCQIGTVVAKAEGRTA